MFHQDFPYHYIEMICADLKIIFISDEKASVTGLTDIHMHSFWELFYLQKGTLTVNSETQTYILQENQLLLIPPNTYHNSVSSADVVKKSIFFTFEKVKTSDTEKLFSELSTLFCNCNFFVLKDCDHLGQLVEKILEHGASDELGKSWRMKANITELIFSLYDHLKAHIDLCLNDTMSPNTYWVYKYAIDRLLDQYYMTNISLEELSEKLFASPQNIARIISTAYGKNFNDLKLELKMRNAKRLLRDTNFSISKIGESIGYTTTRGFLAAFQKYEGCTPSEYRKKVN